MKNYLLIGGAAFVLVACKNEAANDAKVNEEKIEQVQEATAQPLNLIYSLKEMKDQFPLKAENVSIERKFGLPTVEGDEALNNLVQNLSVDYFENVTGETLSKHSTTPENRMLSAWATQKRKVIEDNKGNEPYKEVRVWQEQFSANVSNATPKYMNLTNTYSNYWGGAHGMYGTKYTIIDKESKQALTMDQMFANKGEVRKVMEKYLKVWLKKNDLTWDNLLLEDGKYPLTANVKLKGDSLIVNHNVYEVGPYAMGEIEFGVPLNELRPYFQKDFQP